MEVLRHQLDPEQRAIAADSDKSLLVLAGPGSGKTRLLTNVAAYRCRRTPDERTRILCVTFSVEATNQMRARLRDPALAIPDLTRIHVSNFHQLGALILHRYADQAGWSRASQMLANPQDLLAEITAELGIRTVRIQGLDLAISRVRNRRPGATRGFEPETLKRIMEAYERRKLELSLWDFDDLVIRAVELLDGAPPVLSIVQRLFGYVVVDEVQDTSGHQLELLARITAEGRTPTFGVADDDQMIYAWRDARPENLVEFGERFRAEERYLLGNYRCPPAVVNAANAIIAHVQGRDHTKAATSRVNDRPGEILAAQTDSLAADHAQGVAKIVAEELGRGVPRADIAVLSPISFKFGDLKAACAAGDVPLVHVGDRSLAATPMAQLLLTTLTCQDPSATKGAVDRLNRQLSETNFQASSDEVSMQTRRLLEARTADDALRQIVGWLELMPDDPTVAHVRKIVRAASAELPGASQAHSATSILMEWSRLDARLRREEQAPKLMTTYAAEGLEFDTVIVPYFTASLAPYVPQGQTVDWNEERRKLYVAITRSKNRMIFAYAGQPSAFLADMSGLYRLWRP